MLLVGRVSRKVTPVLRQICDQMAEPECVISRFPCTRRKPMRRSATGFPRTGGLATSVT
jgi:NADH:ubiquinone oxidoreductase subunit B-like Fe-S oxidoreductase